MRAVLLLLVSIGVCLCAVQASNPAPFSNASAQTTATSVDQTTTSVSKAITPVPTVTARVTTVTSTTATTSRTTAPTVKRTEEPAVHTTSTSTYSQTVTTVASPTRTVTARPTTVRPSDEVTPARTVTPTPSPTRSTTVPTTVATTVSTASPTSSPTPVSTPSAPLTTPPTPDPITPAQDQNQTPLAPNGTADGWSPIVPGVNETLNGTYPTPWPLESVTPYPTPSDTPDIDPGMTPYAGSTAITTPTDVVITFDPNATPSPDPALVVPAFTAEVVSSPPFEIPPGMLENELVPSPTETFEPVPSVPGPDDPASSSFLPRWTGYMLFIFLGIAGVAGLALLGTYLGGRSSSPVPVSRRETVAVSPATASPLLLGGAGELPIDQQILVDRIAGFSPGTMPVERLGRNLLRFERAVQERTGDRSVRLGRLLRLSSIPSIDVPPDALAWARAHGFRVLAVDGSGMALVMAALSSTGHSELGVLPVSGMEAASSPVPMPVVPPGWGATSRARSAFLSGMGYYSPIDSSE